MGYETNNENARAKMSNARMNNEIKKDGRNDQCCMG